MSIIVAVGALLSIRSHLMLRHDRGMADHSFEVIRAADEVLIGALDAETGQRGFVITGNPDFLVPYARATKQVIPGAVSELLERVRDNPQQLELIRTLQDATNAKLEELKRTLETRQAQGFPAAQSLVNDRTGIEAMDRIRLVAHQLKQSESLLLAARLTEVHQDEQRIILVIILTTLLSTVLRVVLAAWRSPAILKH